MGISCFLGDIDSISQDWKYHDRIFGAHDRFFLRAPITFVTHLYAMYVRYQVPWGVVIDGWKLFNEKEKYLVACKIMYQKTCSVMSTCKNKPVSSHFQWKTTFSSWFSKQCNMMTWKRKKHCLEPRWKIISSVLGLDYWYETSSQFWWISQFRRFKPSRACNFWLPHCISIFREEEDDRTDTGV